MARAIRGVAFRICCKRLTSEFDGFGEHRTRWIAQGIGTLFEF
jgi:hypothetical protein